MVSPQEKLMRWDWTGRSVFLMIGGIVFSIFGVVMGFMRQLEISEAVGIFIFGLIMSGIGCWMFKGRK